MKNKMLRLLGCLMAAMVGLMALDCQGAPKRLLVVTVAKEYRHGSIDIGSKIIEELAQKTSLFTVDFAKTDADLMTKMTPEALKKYDGVFFLCSQGPITLPDTQGFLDWIKSGKGFIGVHSATDTMRNNPAYMDMIGAEFTGHTVAKVVCNVEDTTHPSTKMLGKTWTVTDEIYFMRNFSREKVHMLLSLDKGPGGGQPGYWPISWCKKYGKGNVFYSALGHEDAVWKTEEYQAHLLGGIKWALGLEKGDSSPGKNP